MTPYVDDSDFVLYVGDVRDCLRELPAASVHTVVTSPPYWGLRDYGTGAWESGDPDCDHAQQRRERDPDSKQATSNGSARDSLAGRDVCRKCGATRVDQQLGLEPTPEAFVAAMVEVFREVRRVLRDDGTLWLNLGDSYVAGQGGRQSSVGEMPAATLQKTNTPRERDDVDTGSWGSRDVTAKTTPARGETYLKPKDLVGMPWRVAFALQADGWYLRSDIIWAKPNPMPESVTDRPTKAHEYVFLLSKGPRYFFDAEAVREPHAEPKGSGGWQSMARRGESGWHAKYPKQKVDESRNDKESANGYMYGGGRNVRSVWEIATQPFPEAHFATFPEALPERCIKAGSSERGCCPECGALWQREVERERYATRPGHASKFDRDDQATVRAAGQGSSPGNVAFGLATRTMSRVETTGWRPSCDHDAAPVPCTVLDPFMGSGTTALVARRLGRKSIGVELNPEYAALCARRLQQLSLLA